MSSKGFVLGVESPSSRLNGSPLQEIPSLNGHSLHPASTNKCCPVIEKKGEPKTRRRLARLEWGLVIRWNTTHNSSCLQEKSSITLIDPIQTAPMDF